MATCFILVTSGADKVDGGRMYAAEIAQRRITACKWPLYKNTPHRKEVLPGDRFVIYLAGQGPESQHFVASATMQGVTTGNGYDADGQDVIITPPESVLILSDVFRFTKLIPIRLILNQLSFIPRNSTNWGVVMQRGCKKISENDYELTLGTAIS